MTNEIDTFNVNTVNYKKLLIKEPGVPEIPAGIPLPMVSKYWWGKLKHFKRKLTPWLFRPRGRPKKGIKSKIYGCEIKKEVHQTKEDNEMVAACVSIGWKEGWWEGDDWVPDNILELEENKAIVEVPNEALEMGKELVIPAEATTVKKFECTICGKEFSTKMTLIYHLRIHNEEELLKCAHCGHGFVNKYQLKVHIRKHQGDLYICSMCSRGFVTAELLKVHFRSHTGEKPFVCDFSGCNKKFNCASNLMQHKAIHDKTTKFLCLVCGASFNQKRCFTTHMQSHEEKTWECQICHKKWNRKAYLKEHMRVHTGDKPYQCTVCKQRFSQYSSMGRHFNRRHKQVENGITNSKSKRPCVTVPNES